MRCQQRYHRTFTEHQPKGQTKKQRKMSEDRIHAAKAKVQRLLDMKVIHEVKYTYWLANMVLVRKKNGKMRMCIDFTDRNKACQKDPFQLPRTDTSIDRAIGCKHFSLLDCFSGYH